MSQFVGNWESTPEGATMESGLIKANSKANFLFAGAEVNISGEY